MITEVKVEGVTELRRAIIQAKDKELAKKLKDANLSAAQIVVDAALPNVPVGSPPDKHPGRLKASVKALASQTSGKARAGTAARVPYAAAIHWGEGAGNVNFTTGATLGRPNRNVQGRPFLWEAADRTLRQVIETYEGEIDDLLDTVRNR